MNYKLSLLPQEKLVQYSNDFNYQTNFFGDSLFTREKTDDLKVRYRQLVKNGTLPTMALFHALDTEARIADRTNYKELVVEKMLIKEKINQTESISYLLNGASATNDELIKYIYDDAGNLISNVLTRVELARMQLLSTGKVSIDENDFKTVVDYGFDEVENKIDFTGWSDSSHDILGDLQRLVDKAEEDGYKITMAITSKKIINYMYNNTAIKAYFEKNTSTSLYTTKCLLQWIDEQFGILFATNDKTYKLKKNDTEKHRFFPENCISWLAIPRGEAFGVDLFGQTPEENDLPEDLIQTGYVNVMQWKEKDPVAIWTKASAMVLIVPRDIDSLYISKVSD